MDKFTFKREYNKLIVRLKKADQYFHNENIDIDERTSDKIINHYNDLIKNISNMQSKYKTLFGVDMTKGNRENGF